MNKTEREMRDLAIKYGFNITKTGRSHWRFFKDGAKPIYASSTSSDVRATKNLEKRLSRVSRSLQ